MRKNEEVKHFKQYDSIKPPTRAASGPVRVRKRHSLQAPKHLGEIIQLANLPKERLRPLVELDKEFPPPPPGDWPEDFSFRAWAGKQDRATLRRWLEQRLERLPPEFRNYVCQDQGGGPVFWFLGAVGRYDYVRDTQRKLSQIIRAVREAEATGRLPTPICLETHSTAFIDESWILRKTTDEFEAALFGSNQAIDARKIRQCEVCSMFFFARRVDSKVCDPVGKCAVTLSKRRERANAKVRAELAAKKKRAKTARETLN